MRTTPSLVLAAVVTAPALSQQNPYIVFPQDPERQAITSSPFVRRPDWNNAAEGLIELNSDYFRGVGDENSSCWVRGFYHWAADENIATAETYSIVLRLADVNGLPNNTAAGLITRIGPLSTPTRGGAPRQSTIMTDVFATAAQVPCTQTWFQGIDFPANPLWPGSPTSPGDGHSLWGADRPSASTATVGENPRMSAPDISWSVDPTGTIAMRGWTYIMGSMVDMPVLHVGGIDPMSARVDPSRPGLPSYGMNGLFPDISGNPRSDGLNLRVTDNVVPSGIVLVAGTAAWGSMPLPIQHRGRVHVDLGSLVPIGFGIMTGGAVEIPMAMPGTIPAGLQGLFFRFQGIVFDPALPLGRLTNAQGTSL